MKEKNKERIRKYSENGIRMKKKNITIVSANGYGKSDHLKYLESQKQTVELKNKPQIIEKEDETILKQPVITKKEQLLEKNRILHKNV